MSDEHTKPLFVPLKKEYYEAFLTGEKTEELRLYGPRWNHRTCTVGREVVLSLGYGKQHRMKGRIWKIKKQHGSTFGSTYRDQIVAVFGTLDVQVACISITDLQPMQTTKGGEKQARAIHQYEDLEDCIVGVVEQFGRPPVLCYDKQKILEVLQGWGMAEEEAIEYFEFNTLGMWVGETTPCFLTTKEGT
jgi:hypothetical protein